MSSANGRRESPHERVSPPDPHGHQGGHLAGMQRRRLLTATVDLAYARGIQALTVATLCERAGVSRRTFYESFDERGECLLAAFEDAVAQATTVVLEAATGNERWREQVRAGLTALLAFLDQEPGVGHLLIVEALSSGPQMMRARKRVLDQVIAFVDQGREEPKKGHEPPPLTAEGTVGALFSVVHARMLERQGPVGDGAAEPGQKPLIELVGPLMAMIVQPYLGPAAARAELKRPPAPSAQKAPRLPADPFRDLPMRLTYRTARVLTTIATSPGASSKQVAKASGITDDGQASRLLSRLQRYELIHDSGIGPTKGMARAWTLTQRGQQLLHAVGHG
jgi:AcrR family transcriptional regulator